MKEIINDLLGYPGLKIIQRPDMFNFSLDSTVLAYFTSLNKTDQTIIDLGCGNGYVPIFLSLRTKARLYGVEIQEEVASLAKRSVELNNLSDQITIINHDMKDVHNLLGVAKADVVTSNPPFFPYKESSLINESDYKTIARHEVKIDLKSLVHTAKVLLKDGGTFSLVHRADRMVDIFLALREEGFEPKKLLFVYPKTSSKEALTIFVESKKSNRVGNLKVLPPLYVHDEDGNYTSDILKIFNYKEKE